MVCLDSKYLVIKLTDLNPILPQTELVILHDTPKPKATNSIPPLEPKKLSQGKITFST